MNRQVTLVTAASGIASYAYAVKANDKDRTDAFSTNDYDYLGEDFEVVLENLLNSFWINIDDIEQNIKDDDSFNRNKQKELQDQAQSDADCQVRGDCTSSQENRNNQKDQENGSDHSHSKHGYGYGYGHSSDGSDGSDGSVSSDASRAPTVSSVSFMIKETIPDIPGLSESYESSGSGTGETSDNADPSNTTDPSINFLGPLDSRGNPVDNELEGIEWTAGTEANILFGTSWDDKLTGSPENDTAHGLEGNDIIIGLGGWDYLFGGPGNDVMFSGEQMSGPFDEDHPDFAGADSSTSGGLLAGGQGHDFMVGTNGNEKFEGGTGVDSIFGYGGNDLIFGGSHDDTLQGGDGYDDIFGGHGDDYIKGGAQDDNIEGGDGDDYILGGDGNDHIWGNDGDDYIVGGQNRVDSAAGEGQVIRGGRGDDVIYATLIGGGGDDGNVLWVEGNQGDDRIYGGDKQQVSATYWGGSGDDYMESGWRNVGDVRLHGNDGDDEMIAGTSNRSVTMKGNDGQDFILGGEGNRKEHFLGGKGDDQIVGGAVTGRVPYDIDNTQILDGGSGNDYIIGGNDSFDQYLIGGIGEDSIIVSGDELYRYGVTYIWGDLEYDDELTDEDVWGSADYIDARANYEDPDADLYVWAGDGADTILAGDGQEFAFIRGQNGDDNIRYGGDWKGLYVYGDADDDDIQPIDVDGAINENQWLYGGTGNDNILAGRTAFSYVSGDEGDDTLQSVDGGSGVMLSDYLYGGAGNDSIVGGSNSQYNGYYIGIQELYGGSGDDEIWGGDLKRFQTIQGGSGNDWIWSGNNIGYSGDLPGAPTVVVSGDRGNYGDEITDSEDGTVDGDDVIDIGDGNLRVIAYGNGGNDKIFGGNGADNLSWEYLYGGSGDDKIWAQQPGEVAANLGEQYMFGGADNDWLSGSNQQDWIYGGDFETDEDTDGIDWILGRGGDDYLFGGFGDDYIDGGAGNDWIFGGDGANVVNGGAGDDYIMSGADDDWADGGSGINTFIGGWGGNTQTGGDDTDIMNGNFGNDVQMGNGGVDYMNGGQGNDWMEGGDDGDYMYGGAWDDVMFGDAGDDRLWGDQGNDKLFGGDGFDRLAADSGRDNIDGGNHSDRLISWDGGDCMWGGAADLENEGGTRKQQFIVRGTGLDEENYTIIMDFWREDAVDVGVSTRNEICVEPDNNNVQDGDEHYPFGTLHYCYNSNQGGVDLYESAAYKRKCFDWETVTGYNPTDIYNDDTFKGPGCENDQGPLWISIPPVEDCNAMIYANISQLKRGHPALRQTRGYGYAGHHGRRYAQFLNGGTWGLDMSSDSDDSIQEIDWDAYWGYADDQSGAYGGAKDDSSSSSSSSSSDESDYYYYSSDDSHSHKSRRGNDFDHKDHSKNAFEVDGKFGKTAGRDDYPEHYAHGSIACLFNGYDMRGIDHGYGHRYSGVAVDNEGYLAPAHHNNRFAQFDGAHFGLGSHTHQLEGTGESYRSRGYYGGTGGHDLYNSSELRLCMQVELCLTCCGNGGQCENQEI